MIGKISKNIENLNIEFTNTLSIVETKTELNMSKKVYNKIKEIDYFKENPGLVKYVDFKEDSLNRKSVIATLKGKKNDSNKTVILIGHTDTVGISDYGNLKKYANYPNELKEKLKTAKLPKDVQKDVNSDNWIFGRGIFDMKCGIAISVSLIEYFSKKIDELEGNIIFAAVGDEEANSGGMLSVVPELIKMQEEEGYQYQAIIDNDYMTERYENDKNKYVYIGTVGKLMPSFYIVGKETHVGEPYKGIDPNQIASSLTQKINLNVKYSDIAEGEVALPPITLKQNDLKEDYSVQTARTANLYFNYSTHNSGPDEVMNEMKNASREAFKEVIDKVETQYMKFSKKSGFPQKKLSWEPRVMSYEELYKKVYEEMGEELNKKIEKIEEELLNDSSLDDRDFSLKLVSKVHELWSNNDPVIIVYFSPPYYPHIFVEGKNRKEKKLLNSVNNALDVIDSEHKIVQKKFYPYISDLSYASAPKDKNIISTLKNNMPALGVKYDLPLKDLQKLDLPVVNIGPFGKDAHKYTERLEKNYSYKVVPKIIHKTIENLLK